MLRCYHLALSSDAVAASRQAISTNAVPVGMRRIGPYRLTSIVRIMVCSLFMSPRHTCSSTMLSGVLLAARVGGLIRSQ